MKKIFFIIVITLSAFICEAQLNIILNMKARPDAAIVTWNTKREILTLIVTAPQGAAPHFKINATITTTDGTPVATTDMLRAQERTINPGAANIFYAAEVLDMQAMVFMGSYRNKLNTTGKLPVGTYIITVKLDEVTGVGTISNIQSKAFVSAGTLLPVLLMPANEAELPSQSAQTAITFRWTALSPLPQEPVHYRIQVFEVLENQKPMQALRANMPLLNKEVVSTTQYIWNPQIGFTDSLPHQYVWTVQTLDGKGNIISAEGITNEGRAEASTFKISFNNHKHYNSKQQ